MHGAIWVIAVDGHVCVHLFDVGEGQRVAVCKEDCAVLVFLCRTAGWGELNRTVARQTSDIQNIDVTVCDLIIRSVFTAIDSVVGCFGHVERVATVAAEHDVVAAVGIEHVIAAVADQCVVAAAAEQSIVAVGPVDRVVALVTVQLIFARTAEHSVVAHTTKGQVVPARPEGQVVVSATIQGIVAIGPVHRVGASTAKQQVVAGQALDRVITSVTSQRIVASATINEVISGPASDGVVARITEHGVVARPAQNGVIVFTAFGIVVARRAVDEVFVITAIGKVVARLRRDCIVANTAIRHLRARLQAHTQTVIAAVAIKRVIAQTVAGVRRDVDGIVACTPIHQVVTIAWVDEVVAACTQDDVVGISIAVADDVAVLVIGLAGVVIPCSHGLGEVFTVHRAIRRVWRCPANNLFNVGEHDTFVCDRSVNCAVFGVVWIIDHSGHVKPDICDVQDIMVAIRNGIVHAVFATVDGGVHQGRWVVQTDCVIAISAKDSVLVVVQADEVIAAVSFDIATAHVQRVVAAAAIDTVTKAARNTVLALITVIGVGTGACTRDGVIP